MKTGIAIFIIVVSITFGLVGFWFGFRNSQVKNTTPKPSRETESREVVDEVVDPRPEVLARLRQAEVSVPEENVRTSFINGSAVFHVDIFAGDMLLGDEIALQDDNVFATFAVNSGGSGRFVYLVWLKDAEISFNQIDEVYLGDRIRVQSISADTDTVTVTYLTRKPDEPFAAEPTVKTVAKFGFGGDKLVAQ